MVGLHGILAGHVKVGRPMTAGFYPIAAVFRKVGFRNP
jgi:hypothetical protein